MGKKKEIIVARYCDTDIFFMEDGWFDATEAAKKFGKRVDVWLKTQETQDYVFALLKSFNTTKKHHLIRTKLGRGGGTWLHPKLAIIFARWLSPDFAVWCDIHIDNILRGDHPQIDWRRLRSTAACSFKMMCDSLKLTREKKGKSTDARHYINEAKLINWVLTGKYARLDREQLTVKQLDILGKLETLNGVLIGQGIEYAERKAELVNYVSTHTEVKQLFVSAQQQLVQ